MLVVERKVGGGKGEADGAALAGLQWDTLEPHQLSDGLNHAGHESPYVQLDSFGGFTGAAVRYIRRHGERRTALQHRG